MSARDRLKEPKNLDETRPLGIPVLKERVLPWDPSPPHAPQALEKYAMLCARLAENPHQQASVLAEHGIPDDAALRRLHRSFAELFQEHPSEAQRWRALVASHRARPPIAGDRIPASAAPASIDATLVPSSKELAAALDRPIAPFPITPYGQPGSYAEIPGAPWSSTPAAPVPLGTFDATLVPRSAPSAASEPEPSLPTEEPSATSENVTAAESVRDLVVRRLKFGDGLGDLVLRGADLAELDFSRAELNGMDLSGANLARCKFIDARLNKAKLARADLTEANFTGADLSGADLTNAKLERARFERAKLVDAHLNDAKASNANFDGASLSRVRARGAVLNSASLRQIDAADSDWQRAELDGACFDKAVLKNAVLSRSRGARARFAGADLTAAKLERFIGDEANFEAAILVSTELEHASFPRASFAGAVLRDALCNRAELVDARLNSADLSGAMLRQAKLCGADVRDARLAGADLQGADVSRADVRGAKLASARGYIQKGR